MLNLFQHLAGGKYGLRFMGLENLYDFLADSVKKPDIFHKIEDFERSNKFRMTVNLAQGRRFSGGIFLVFDCVVEHLANSFKLIIPQRTVDKLLRK